MDQILIQELCVVFFYHLWAQQWKLFDWGTQDCLGLTMMKMDQVLCCFHFYGDYSKKCQPYLSNYSTE